MRRLDRAKSHKYRQLLIVLVVVFVVSPFFKTGLGSILTILMLLYTIIIIIRSFTLPKFLFTIYLAIAVMAFFLELGASMGWIPFFNQAFSLLAQGIFALYLGGAAFWIARDIFSASKVTFDTVRGGISVYLLIGFVWALFYGMVATLDSNAFSQELVQGGSYLKTLHFSFTTLTTLGYGDIVPISEIALVLSNLEAVIGQMYVAVFIAILIGGYLAQHSKK